MFTGLIEDVGTVRALDRSGTAGRLVVMTALPLETVAIGDSVAVNGACLTVVTKGGGALAFDVSPETLSRTALGGLSPGSRVNLERALRVGDRLGGHLVTGHIDCVATVAARREESGNIIFSFSLPPENSRYVIAKGSVAIDGISLTVNSVSGSGFTVNVIPHTAAMTTLRYRKPGDPVNVETDIIGRYVERLLGGTAAAGGGVTLQSLLENGFV